MRKSWLRWRVQAVFGGDRLPKCPGAQVYASARDIIRWLPEAVSWHCMQTANLRTMSEKQNPHYHLYNHLTVSDMENSEPAGEDEWFHYTPLNPDKREVRLVSYRLDQVTTPCNDDEWGILTIPLVDAPEFTAISYVWGSPARNRPIICSGKKLSVTESAFSVLQRCRISNAKFIWIDAICINQDDSSERGAQVSFMGDIYSRAAEVAIYLEGFETEDANQIEDFIKLMQRHCSRLISHDGIFNGSALSREIVETVFEKITVDQWTALFKIFGHQYFTRSWVFQEFLLGFEKERSFMWLANLRVSTTLFYILSNLGWWTNFSTKQQTYYQVFSRHSSDICSRSANFMNAIWGARRRTPHDRHNIPFHSLMASTRQLHATDYRDKVYAFLAIGIGGGPDTIQPDYSTESTVEDLYLRVATAFVQSGSISFLRSAGLQGNPKLPSWVPDWAYVEFKAPPPWSADEESIGRACGDTVPRLSLADSSRLVVTGGPVGTITSIVDGAENERRRFTLTFEWIHAFLNHMQKENKDCGRTGEPWKDDIRQALICKKLDVEAHDYDMTFLHFPTGPKPFSRKFSELLHSFTLEGPWEYGVLESDDQESKYIWFIGIAISTYRIGHVHTDFLGMFPNEARVGDVVVILLGGEMPFVLRPVGEEYLLVGSCYVHGAMDGELIYCSEDGEGIKVDGKHVRTFKLI